MKFNSLQLYKCFCNSTTKVQLTKTIPTARTVEEKQEEGIVGSTKSPKHKKDMKRKRKKTAGLNIPASHKPPSASTTNSKTNMKISQLSNFLQKQKNDEVARKSKLNQFLE